MTFWKVSEKSVLCMITQQEIRDLGFELPQLQLDKEKTKEFIQTILENAQQVIEVNMDEEVHNFMAAMMPDQRVVLSISFENDKAATRTPEEFKQFIEQVSTMAATDRLEKIQEIKEVKEPEKLSNQYVIQFKQLDPILEFCQVCQDTKVKESSLIKYNYQYYFIVSFEEGQEEKEIVSFITLAKEYEGSIIDNPLLHEVLKEHGTYLVKENVVNKLKEVC